MQRRSFIALVTAVCWPIATHAQQNAIPVIGFLSVGSPVGFAAEVAAFKQGLSDTGWTVGQNVAVEYRWAESRFDRLPDLAGELVAAHVAVIATSGGVPAARAAKNATASIPIVFEIGVDPIEAGLVQSFAHPGGNLTGINIATGELNPKRLELLAELVPDTGIIATLVNPKNSPDRMISVMQQAARSKGIQLPVLKAGTEGEFEPAFASLAALHAGALLVSNDPFFYTRRDQLVTLAARYNVPAMYEWREFAAIGGLTSYGTSLAAVYRRFGAYAGRVLAGAKPADLPVEQPTKFELVINLKTAKALGLTVPQVLLARADEVIE